MSWNLEAKGKGSFLIFGNRNQFFKLSRSISLIKAVDAVGNYGIVKFYIVSDSDEQAVTEAIKQKKMGFYHFNSYTDDACLSSFVNLKKGFIEIETLMESRRDSMGKEWTYLKIFKADSLPQLPTRYT